MTDRRRFIRCVVPLALGTVALRAIAAEPPRVEESEPAAAALGYKHDATRVDRAKFPKYQPGQVCANCALYQAKPTDAWGPCSALAGKQVNAKGWCSAWVKRA